MSKKNTYDIEKMSKEGLADIDIDESKLPQLIADRMALIEETNKAYKEAKEKEKTSREKVDRVLKRADELIKETEALKGELTTEKKKFLMFEYTSKKEEISAIKTKLKKMVENDIESADARKQLAEVQSALADSQVSILKVQETLMAYQNQVADMTKFLYRLCAFNISTTQSIWISLEASITGASEEQLGELAKQQLYLTIDQIKNQENILGKVRENEKVIDALGIEIDVHKQEIDSNKKENINLDKQIKILKQKEEELFAQLHAKGMLIQETIKHDEKQDIQIKEQIQKGIERDKKIEERIAYDEKQDKELKEHALKDAEHDKQIKERIAYDEKQDKILEQQAHKDEEHDKQIAERIAYDEKQDKILEEQAYKTEKHERQIKDRVAYDANQDKILDEHTRKILEYDKLLLIQQEKNDKYEQELANLQELNNELKQEILQNVNEIKKMAEIIEQINEEKSSKRVSLYSLILGGISLIGVIINFII